mgnify:CR=1 FL=1
MDVIVIDSVAALVPRAELDGEMGDSLPGLQARLMSQALRKITAIVSSSNTCFIFINQLREKIGAALHVPQRKWDALDCVESDDIFVVIKPGASIERGHVADLSPLLRQAIVAFFQQDLVEAELLLPWSAQQLRKELYANCEVLEEGAGDEGAVFRLRGEADTGERLRAQFALTR